jgi:hypothetical protein
MLAAFGDVTMAVAFHCHDRPEQIAREGVALTNGNATTAMMRRRPMGCIIRRPSFHPN